MFDVGGMEVLVVGVVALIVVGPKDLPRLLRSAGAIVRKIREMANEFKAGIDTLATEVEQEVAREADPFADLRQEEGLQPGMSPEEVTKHIMANREREAAEKAAMEEAQKQSSTDTASKDKDGEGASS
ncbi:Sec-independent protein translocase protein TatB [Kordiimonas marina]|uniref:Sec-independent protein translocase protein TatB n=1 Tax=Kordiimonas marina TaxID=2872312 RepID=UPI001FF430CC|nr:Sec-independent protein translocase protein TatB [Kordiimonas marina]MCJ9430256.1 Sec-independent protein translocase protein TatB [Kordiimonas marina]